MAAGNFLNKLKIQISFQPPRCSACSVRDIACLQPWLAQIDFTVPPTPLRRDLGFSARDMTIRRDLLTQSSWHKSKYNPNMKATGVSETPVGGYHKRCHTQRVKHFHKL